MANYFYQQTAIEGLKNAGYVQVKELGSNADFQFYLANPSALISYDSTETYANWLIAQGYYAKKKTPLESAASGITTAIKTAIPNVGVTPVIAALVLLGVVVFIREKGL